MPLTELGRGQARQLGKGIAAAGLQFDAVYSSPLARAYETAEIVSKMLGLSQKPTIIESLIERDFGVMTGKPTSSIVELCSPDIVQTDTITYFLHPEGAETFPHLLARGAKAFKDISQLQQSGTALLVCHGDIGKMIYAAATGTDWMKVLTDFHFGNGELIALEPKGKAHVIELDQHNL